MHGRWPTKLPGIGFQVRGAIAFRPPSEHRGDRAGAEAAARLALEHTGRAIAEEHVPDELEIARQRLTQETQAWREAKDGSKVHWRARLTLTLSQKDETRSQEHLDALRDARLTAEREQVRQDWIRNVVLAAPDTARVWWLLSHTDSSPEPEWKEFREHILPLVGGADDVQSKAERFAHGVAHLWDKLGDDPGRHARFTATVHDVLDRMGWTDTETWWDPSGPAAHTGAGVAAGAGSEARPRGGRPGAAT
ncbi:hypothetical protein GCM10009665_50340 [Kitasatospora nipponensis]|uniref:Uncharacterized protein n=1 Tax=Kitasatospora nipponensis TaxID=258049 RepID=A0ABP4HCZ9_9ACTN